MRPRRLRRLTACLMLPALAAGCQREGSESGGMSDSTFVGVMGALRRVNDDRMLHPVPPHPMPRGPNGTAPTIEQSRTRDSLQQIRNDSVKVVDSTARAAVLARFKVTPDQLREKARALALTPQRSQRVMEAVARENQRLDSLARRKATPRAATPDLKSPSLR
ncbi:MAG: hypothetical protein HYX65_07205 [Gemmatimonadetes bacterium]|nr:hypothetical protein [Gemmatimonadota bacterium]